ncbi:MAG: prolyl oligopeptidase family serine peptidase [Saprospiraceae bacterium]|nr:prolyl oligopeptidase family serine peptidase [Saprospiraceae bacterium]
MKKALLLMLLATLPFLLFAQSADELQKSVQQLQNQVEGYRHTFDMLNKKIDDLLWYEKVGDLAYIDKVQMTGPPVWKEKNPAAQGAGNPVIFSSYVFIPKSVEANKKYPLIVLPHDGVHSNFTTAYAHVIRELVYQGYIVVAADYRGSTGYGSSFYRKIDYGGREVNDVNVSRDYMLENYDIVDKNRVGIIGWSHGGLITLMNIFEYPTDYQVAFAGVRVTDLIARMGYKNENYRDLFEAEYHITQSAEENVKEYRRRSPVWNVEKMKDTPLLIHTNTNDEDVNVLELEQLIRALKAEGKKFEYEIFNNIEGGHAFDRLDTKIAQEIRVKIYKYLHQYLKPDQVINNMKDLRKAAYRF